MQGCTDVKYILLDVGVVFFGLDFGLHWKSEGEKHNDRTVLRTQ